MTEPQVWTMIGVFTTLMLGMLTIVSTLFVRILRTEIGGLRAELSSEIRGVHTRLDSLDRDVNALMKHTFGLDRGDCSP